MTAYYNENEPYAVQWLRNLISKGLIADGIVDDRSIYEVQPNDVRGFAQCHFFAGIAGWSYALRIAQWTDERPVWTGSCPCQPFSSAGFLRGCEDERHLWPTWFRLIRECRPSAVLGEQVDDAGLAWFDHVANDMEEDGYAVAAANLCSAGAGAPHVRQRLYWWAMDSDAKRLRWERSGTHSPRTNRMVGELERLVQSEIQLSVPSGKYGTLADGIPSKLAILRSIGNSIDPQVAAGFIGAVMDCMP